jgi:predicted DNA-binding transcriptional regulator
VTADQKQETVQYHRAPPRYAKAASTLILDQSISDGAVRLYLYLQWRAGQKNTNFRAKSTMALELGVTSRTIRNRIAELAAAGWIAVVERGVIGEEQTSNHYHVFESRKMAKMWRAGYVPAEGDRLQPIPKLEARKTRAGKGGAPKKAVKLSSDAVNSSSPPPGTQVHPNELPSNPETNTPDANAPVSVPAIVPPAIMPKPGSYQERTGKTDEECELERIEEAKRQLALDEWRMQRNENKVLLRQAILHHLHLSGSRGEMYVTMLEGKQSKRNKRRAGDADAFDEAAAELAGAPVSANEFTDWCEWYRKTELHGSKDASITSKPDKMVGSILAYRALNVKPVGASGLGAFKVAEAS